LSADECGRACAVAGIGQRDLQRYAATYPALFPTRPFDGTFLATLALAGAFAAPWCEAPRLRAANRAGLFVFGLDYLVENAAASPAGIVDPLLAVADGAAPTGDAPLTRPLADLRDELATAPAYPALRPLWRDALASMLAAMVREYGWKAAQKADGAVTPATLSEYVDNSDSVGFLFVYLSHWIATIEQPCPRHTEELVAAGRWAQQVLRLVNDLGTAKRERYWGDVNALALGAAPADVLAHIAQRRGCCRTLLDRLRGHHPELTGYLDRQMSFNEGLYRLGDYWGEP
jgi:hypothetical protein